MNCALGSRRNSYLNGSPRASGAHSMKAMNDRRATRMRFTRRKVDPTSFCQTAWPGTADWIGFPATCRVPRKRGSERIPGRPTRQVRSHPRIAAGSPALTWRLALGSGRLEYETYATVLSPRIARHEPGACTGCRWPAGRRANAGNSRPGSSARQNRGIARLPARTLGVSADCAEYGGCPPAEIQRQEMQRSHQRDQAEAG